MKTLALVATMWCVTVIVFAQSYDNNWLFGYKCSLNFTNGSPQPILSSSMVAWETSAAISSKAGELQFYTNGNTVWNASNQIMDNGTGLWLGNRVLGSWYGDSLLDYGTSSTQGILVLPSITDSNQYIVLTQNAFPDTGIRVSTVDMAFNAGLGKVLAKNQTVYQGHFFSEKLAACRHANGRDWWLVSLEQQSNYYSVLLYDAQGINLHHIDTVGAPLIYMGQMVFSPKGNFLGIVSGFGHIQVLNFDRCTGTLTDNNYFGYNAGTYFNNNTFYGAAFSPDESKFYTAAFAGSEIIQFAFDTITQTFNSPALTIWSGAFIDTNQLECQRVVIGQMRLGPDNRIYCSLSPMCTNQSPWSLYQYNLSIINSPDSLGIACDFQPAALFIGNTPHYLLGGLPNIPNYELGKLIGSPCDTLFNALVDATPENATLNIYPNPFTNSFAIRIGGIKSAQRVEILDVLGRVAYAASVSSQQVVYTVDASLFAPGVYVVRVGGSGAQRVQKLIRQ
jgi:hypothetical protein